MKTFLKPSVAERTIPTPDGEFLAHYSVKGLAGLSFPSGKSRRGRTSEAGKVSASVRRWHAAAGRALKRALAGRATGRLPPLDLSAGTVFQSRVWEALRRIPSGRTLSYQQVAQAIGKSRAVRAVGGACGANPVPIFIPCHRVLASDGSLGGFSAGLDWKRTLLTREQFRNPRKAVLRALEL